jgi:hypothetical protein
MPASRLEALARVVDRAKGVLCWLARFATRAAVVGGIAGFLLWWIEASGRVDEWWRGTVGSLLVLAVLLAPAAWLLYVRLALRELAELPEKLGGVALRRAGQLGQFGRVQPMEDVEPERPKGGLVAGVRSVKGIVGDYRDVVGSWGAVAQLLVPWFWFLSTAALAAVPILVLLVAVSGLLEATVR